MSKIIKTGLVLLNSLIIGGLLGLVLSVSCEAKNNNIVLTQDISNRVNINSVANNYILYLYYRNNCEWCHKFAPIVSSVANKYGLRVVKVNADNNDPLDVSPNGVPMLYAHDNKHNITHLISAGYMSRDQLVRALGRL